MAVPSARFSSGFLTWQLGPPRPQVIRDVISVHMEGLSSHWQEEQEQEGETTRTRNVAVSLKWEWPLSSLLPVAVELGLSTSRTSHSTLTHPEASSCYCAPQRETDHAELGFCLPSYWVQDHACLFGLCYRSWARGWSFVETSG